MAWQETSPGHYERDFDSLERFYHTIADAGAPLNKQHFLISTTLRLKTSPPPHQVLNAWKALRQQYPQIAAAADETGTRFVYDVPSATELQAWVDKSCFLEEDGSAQEKYEKEKPSSLVRLFYFPASREILFRTPHWRMDGIGIMHLQGAFIRILGNGPPDEIQFDGSETNNLSPSLDEAANVPLVVTQAMSQAADEELEVCLQGLPAVSISTLPNVLPTTTRRVTSSFDVDTTSRIIHACKSRGLTVTAGIDAAMIVATLPYAERNFDPATRGQGGGKYTAFNTIDLRKYLPAPFSGPKAAVSIYHTGIPISIDLNVHKDFDSIATLVREVYKRDFSTENPRNIFQFLAEYVHKVIGILGSPPANPLHASAHPELSSIGIVNDYLPDIFKGSASVIEVEEWWIAVEVIDRLLRATLWTFNGQMNLSLNWNEAFYEDEFVHDFMNKWKETILRELAVRKKSPYLTLYSQNTSEQLPGLLLAENEIKNK
ncbi:unnamed protein product [Penicillium glandicola]